MADLFLQYGVTSVRDTGGNLEELVALRERLKQRAKPVPHIYFSGPLLDGHSRFTTVRSGATRTGRDVMTRNAAQTRVLH